MAVARLRFPSALTTVCTVFDTDYLRARGAVCRRLLVMAVPTIIAMTACTSGNRCNEQYPCYDGDVCLDGICHPGCSGDGKLVRVGVCQYAMDTCFGGTGQNLTSRCSFPCSPGTNEDGGQGSCPEGMVCRNPNGWGVTYCGTTGIDYVNCATDADCIGAFAEVRQ